MEKLTKEAARKQQALSNKGMREAIKATVLRLLKNNPFGMVICPKVSYPLYPGAVLALSTQLTKSSMRI